MPHRGHCGSLSAFSGSQAARPKTGAAAAVAARTRRAQLVTQPLVLHMVLLPHPSEGTIRFVARGPTAGLLPLVLRFGAMLYSRLPEALTPLTAEGRSLRRRSHRVFPPIAAIPAEAEALPRATSRRRSARRRVVCADPVVTHREAREPVPTLHAHLWEDWSSSPRRLSTMYPCGDRP